METKKILVMTSVSEEGSQVRHLLHLFLRIEEVVVEVVHSYLHLLRSHPDPYHQYQPIIQLMCWMLTKNVNENTDKYIDENMERIVYKNVDENISRCYHI